MTSPPPAMPSEDYDAIEAAVMDTARGRWFLSEYARRNRTADTSLLLAAIERLEGLLAAERPQSPHEPVTTQALITSADSELFAVDVHAEHETDAAVLAASASLPDPEPEIVEIDDESLIWPTEPAETHAAPEAPQPQKMLAAPTLEIPLARTYAPEPYIVDPAELDALTFEEKSVYFA